MNGEPLLEVRALSVTLRSRGRVVHAVRDCSFRLHGGEVLALVGESGSGKTTLARAIAGVVLPRSGTIRFRGRDLGALARADARPLRRRIQMVFQDPDASLNPAHRVGGILAEPLQVIRYGDRAAIAARIRELLAMVRLDAALLDKRPRQLSGGEKQRVAIARALAMEPELLVADEPLSSLDVSTQAAIAALFRSLQQRLRLGLLFISHDLAAVRQLADRVAVLYGGEIVESGPAGRVLDAPAHPYTRLLLAAMPDLEHRRLDLPLADAIDRLEELPDLPQACHYRPRCLDRAAVCDARAELAAVGADRAHLARCHFRDGPPAAAPG
ncbi:MAG TPA: oligopeptide/dipeptide ABC transporter ATP-binding protein [Steroidobacteraceae bacterium]|nr:oligopeptide/dipeptide ABC transporter ATP-binding protein [Steroidobacteraceae bacterium]